MRSVIRMRTKTHRVLWAMRYHPASSMKIRPTVLLTDRQGNRTENTYTLLDNKFLQKGAYQIAYNGQSARLR